MSIILTGILISCHLWSTVLEDRRLDGVIDFFCFVII